MGDGRWEGHWYFGAEGLGFEDMASLKNGRMGWDGNWNAL